MNQLFTLTTPTNWGSLHPLVVHFPVSLLFVSPFFILLGIIFKTSSKSFYLSTLILMTLGAASTFLAVSSGEMASERLDLLPQAALTLNAHYELGEKCRTFFTALTLIFAIYFFAYDILTKKLSKGIHILFLFFYLLAYGYSLQILWLTAHQGGKLVHLHEIKSSLYLTDPKK